MQFKLLLWGPARGNPVVSVSDSRSGGCEFQTRMRRNFLPAYFRLSLLLKACEKGSQWFWKEISFSSEKARKHMCVADPSC